MTCHSGAHMNGKHPHVLDALSVHNGVMFSTRCHDLIKRLPSTSRAPPAENIIICLRRFNA